MTTGLELIDESGFGSREFRLMAIRRATLADLDASSNLSSTTYRSTYAGMYSKDSWLDFATPEFFAANWRSEISGEDQEREGPVLVSEVPGGKIVGFASARRIGDRGDL